MKVVMVVASVLALLALKGCDGASSDTTPEAVKTAAATAATAAPAVSSDIPEFATTKSGDHVLLNPNDLTEKAPASYKVKFETSTGEFVVDVQREWAPNGADRFYNLVRNGYYDGAVFFRVVAGFMVQFGINGDPAVNTKWQKATIADDEVIKSNTPGYLSFATSGPNSRTTQVFINFGNNKRLDAMGFSPFGVVSGDGMGVVKTIEDKYGEGFPSGRGPAQGRIQSQGNSYLRASYADMDFIKKASIVE